MDSSVRSNGMRNVMMRISENVDDQDVMGAIRNLQVVQENKSKELERHIITETVRKLHQGNQYMAGCMTLMGMIYSTVCERFESFDNESKLEAERSRGICFKCLKGSYLARVCTSGMGVLCQDRKKNLFETPLSTATRCMESEHQ